MEPVEARICQSIDEPPVQRIVC
ncbi:hypothetical protein MTR67_000051 [Solanum verrucosum]|uniref:Uncharacterized protein n=1 Tax=Solanum verrucosum TaxID=315347 RepID=A0AAF0T664_SOLVR|nr:hypothetical protein MTR67_000051 [Solanum verrucosum]